MSAPRRRSAGTTSNHDRYRNAFIGHVHRLLFTGYSSLIPSEYTTAEEDDITGELCKHMKRLTEEAPTSPWMSRYSIHDQDPVNDARAAATGIQRRGKRRPRLDIRIVNKSRIPNTSFSIEAKRLYRTNSVSQYMEEEGLQAFVDEYYAKTEDACGMLGYIQSGKPEDWLRRLHSKLLASSSVTAVSAREAWVQSQESSGLTMVYRTQHSRAKSGTMLDVFHTLLDFT